MSISVNSETSSNSSINSSLSKKFELDKISTTASVATTSEDLSINSSKGNYSSNCSLNSNNEWEDYLKVGEELSAKSSTDDHSSNNTLNNNSEWKNYLEAGYNNHSFDPGISSSESEGDYERLIKARKQNQIESYKQKKFHEESFDNIQPPNWNGMRLKRWNSNKIILRFYTQKLLDSNRYRSIDDNRYNVCLKPNHKFKWYVYRSSAPAEADVRKPFMIPDGVTNENLIEIIEEVYVYIMKFVKKYCLIVHRALHYKLEEP